MTEFIVSIEDVNLRLDVFLLKCLQGVTRSHIKHLIEMGNVTLNGKQKKSGEKLRTGDIITVLDIVPKELSAKPENIDLEIVYEDSDIAVVNKPQGLVVHPANGNESGTMVNALLFHLKNLSSINGVIRPGIVHRIDKNTSGLLVVAKNDAAHVSLANQIKNKTCYRHYIALVNGNIKVESGRIETHIGRNKLDRKQMAVVGGNEGRHAVTNYKVIERFLKYTLVEFVLETGRTHQIRVHAKYINHTIVGDDVYGSKDKEFKLNGQLLHAFQLEFNHPTTNERLCFNAPLPDYFNNVINKLKKVYK